MRLKAVVALLVGRGTLTTISGVMFGSESSFCSSTYGNSRIDFMYANPSMMRSVVDAGILVDKWTSSRPSTYVSAFYDPSDHRPILVDFDLTR